MMGMKTFHCQHMPVATEQMRAGSCAYQIKVTVEAQDPGSVLHRRRLREGCHAPRKCAGQF
jgi:hypothetical protein